MDLKTVTKMKSDLNLLDMNMLARLINPNNVKYLSLVQYMHQQFMDSEDDASMSVIFKSARQIASESNLSLNFVLAALDEMERMELIVRQGGVILNKHFLMFSCF